jgi:hypothetical protein
MSGQAGIHDETTGAFRSALHTVMVATASCAALAGFIGWRWIEDP